MFEHIVLRRTAGGLPISAGQIAEALLYYQKVHIVVDRGTLQNLVRQIGTGHILALLRRAEISAVYCEEILGTYTDSAGVSQYHNYVSMKVAGHETVGKFKNPQERLQYFIEGQGISKREATVFARCSSSSPEIAESCSRIRLSARADNSDVLTRSAASQNGAAASPVARSLQDRFLPAGRWSKKWWRHSSNASFRPNRFS